MRALAPDVEEREHEPVVEPPLQRRLQRLVVGEARVVVQVDVGVALVGPQEVGRQRGAPVGARGQRRVLVLRVERGAQRRRVDVRLAQQVLRRGADPGDVEDQLARELVLHADVPRVDLGRVEVVGGRGHPQRRGGVPACGAEVLQQPPLEIRVQHAGRVAAHVEDDVAHRAVVEDPAAAANDGHALPGEVVHEAEAGRHAERVPALHRVGDPLAGLVGAVELVRARGQPADEARVDRLAAWRGPSRPSRR